ncbi:tetratricopeptide repeat protein [Bernardetia sp.]|uniref:tetratricopeptide repeat-containing sensor histidine kinase n=1 Tax=Bernardetia sp. TaxID=1937974 RepID=UPI0025C44D40|nr:tetratricopeptide repeat protein [Bernardetia sp.]
MPVLCYSQSEDISLAEIDIQNRFVEDLYETKPEKALEKSEKLLQLSEKKKYKKGQVWAWFGKALYYEKMNKYSEVLKYINKAIKISELDTIKHNTAKLYLSKGKYLSKNGEMDSAINSLITAEKKVNYLEKKTKVNVQFEIYNTLGRSYERVGKIEKATEYYVKAVKHAQKNDFYRGEGTGLFNLGYIYELEKKYDKAEDCYKQSIKASQRAQDTSYIVYSNVYLSGIYSKKELPKESLKYLNYALKLAKEHQNKKSLGFVYFELADYYMKSNDLENTILYLEKSKRIDIENNDIEGVVLNYFQATKTYIKFKEYDLAIQKARQGLEKAKKSELKMYVMDFNLAISVIEEQRGNFEEAYKSYKIHSELRKSILNEQTVEKINELQTQYETEKKEQQITTLTQQNKIQELEVRNSYYTIAVLVVVALAVLVVVWVFFRQKNIIEKYEKEQAKLRWRRAQLNPHFFFNVLSALQTLLYEKREGEAIEYIAGFSTLMRTVLEESNKEKNSLEKEIEFLETYLSLEQLSLDFDYEIILESDDIEVEDIMIPSMVLQPFVENAIEHGLRKSVKGEKKITIKVIEKSLDTLEISVRDNGAGRSKERRKNHVSRALEITNDRKKLMKDAFDYHIIDHQDEEQNPTGTEVVFTLKI